MVEFELHIDSETIYAISLPVAPNKGDQIEIDGGIVEVVNRRWVPVGDEFVLNCYTNWVRRPGSR